MYLYIVKKSQPIFTYVFLLCKNAFQDRYGALDGIVYLEVT